MAIGSPVMSGGNTIATFTPAPGLSYGTTYKVRVTTAATNAGNVPAVGFTMASGFTTPTDSTPGVVISQVYANGGASASFASDFVELHNRGAASVSLSGWSLQYASATGNFSSKLALSGTIAAGGFLLIQIGSTVVGTLPNADFLTGAFSLGASGKVALVSNNTNLGVACPATTAVVDFVGYGSASNPCTEAAPTGLQSPTTASLRKNVGCQDTNDNSADFSTVTAAPRYSGSTPVVCPGTTLNEFNTGEIDYCNVQFPTSMTKPTGTVTDEIFTQIYEFGLTEAAGPGTGLIVQIGYGPTNVNPEYQSGWIWSAATFNTQIGNNDEWKGTFTAPAAGTWNYGARVSLDGFRWTYCDLNGAGSNGGLSFETNQLPVLTVTP
jgi:hypothetical protein